MAVRRHVSGSSVVVPAVDTASSTAAIRSLGRAGVRVVGVSEHETPPGFASKYCEETVAVPDPESDLSGYGAALLDLAKRSDVETILPLCEEDVYVLARNKQVFAAHVGTPWPSFETLRAVQDRVRLFEAARSAGVPAPATSDFDDWDGRDAGVVVKPRYTVPSDEYDARFAGVSPDEYTSVYVSPDDDVSRDDLVAAMGHVPIVQEYVSTPDEYGFFALYDHGEAVATFQHRQRRGWKYCGGPSAYRESVDIPELEAAGLRLLDELDWHGVAMVEFLRDPETGTFKLMEVNPRFWSSLPFTIQAGVDFPALYWQQATGGSVETPPDYDVGVAGHLLWGEVLHLQSILRDDYPLVERPSFLRSLADVAGSLVRSPRFDYLDRRDPGPFLRDLRNRLPVRRLFSPGATPHAPSGETDDRHDAADGRSDDPDLATVDGP